MRKIIKCPECKSDAITRTSVGILVENQQPEKGWRKTRLSVEKDKRSYECQNCEHQWKRKAK